MLMITHNKNKLICLNKNVLLAHIVETALGKVSFRRESVRGGDAFIGADLCKGLIPSGCSWDLKRLG